MTTTTHRPRLLDRRPGPAVDLAPTVDRIGAVLPDGNPVIPVPPSTHPAEELVHPWAD